MIRNGLYSVISKVLDGIEGNSVGVSVVQDGTMRGGGSIYYHVGSYTCSNGKWKGDGSSQSAVSKSVARLEHRLGVRLIQRSTRTLSLTTEGQAYYERVTPLLRAIEDAEDVVQTASEAKGLLRVSAPQEFGRMLIATWAPEFLARHPGVKLELNVTDRNVDIIREGYDLAVRMGPLRDTELISRKLADLHWILVASPAYLERRGHPETVQDLRTHSCLRYLTYGLPCPFAFADGQSVIPDGPFDTADSGSLRPVAH